jgi:hypothetical protein
LASQRSWSRLPSFIVLYSQRAQISRADQAYILKEVRLTGPINNVFRNFNESWNLIFESNCHRYITRPVNWPTSEMKLSENWARMCPVSEKWAYFSRAPVAHAHHPPTLEAEIGKTEVQHQPEQ